jgi:hypothetical protein
MVMRCFWAGLEGLVILTVFLMRANDFKKLAISGTSMESVSRGGEDERINDKRRRSEMWHGVFLEKSPSFGGAAKPRKQSGTFLEKTTPSSSCTICPATILKSSRRPQLACCDINLFCGLSRSKGTGGRVTCPRHPYQSSISLLIIPKPGFSHAAIKPRVLYVASLSSSRMAKLKLQTPIIALHHH